jgi:Domain of unknown function (DUF6250)
VKSIHPLFQALAGTFLCGACVPTGSAPPYDAGTTSTAATPAFRPSLNVMNGPFEENFDRPDSGEGTWAGLGATVDSGGGLVIGPREGGAPAREGGAEGGTATGDAGDLLLRDSGLEGAPIDRANLGPNWIQIKTSAWKVENGKLCVQNAHNHGIWLNRTLPVNARIEFDATPFTEEGDLKAEVWGDGVSYATGSSYTNATSYLTILGGWKNTLQVLARFNEHGTDRKEIKIDKDSDDPRQRPVQKGQTYHFKIERTDGKTIRWSVDGVDFFSWSDPTPLAGQGHDHFGFNEWEAKVCFDNVKVTPL